MKRRTQTRIRLIVTLLLFGGLCWLAYRTVRQNRLNHQLIVAIKQNQFEHRSVADVLACLKRGADPNTCYEPDRKVSRWNRFLIVLGLKKLPVLPKQPALLLALEGDLNRGGSDPAEWYWGDSDIVKALLRYGADTRVKDRYGRTPLVASFCPLPDALASSSSINWPNWECELALIAAGADLEARDEEGNTALMVGGGDLEMGNEIEAALVHKGARVNAVTQDGTSALIYHAHCGQQRGLQLLLDHDADVNHTDRYGWTALMYASQREGCERMVDALVKQGADVNARATDGCTALMAAASSGCSANLRVLLQHGAVVDAQDQSGQTALTYTALIGNETCVRLLLKSGASVAWKNANGTTLYQLLQKRGADIRGRNTDQLFISNKNPPDVGPKNEAVIRLLKEHGMRE